MAKRDYSELESYLSTPEPAPEPAVPPRDYSAMEANITTPESADAFTILRSNNERTAEDRIRHSLVREWGPPEGKTPLEWDIQARLTALEADKLAAGLQHEEARVISNKDWIANRDAYEAQRQKDIAELKQFRLEARDRILEQLKAGPDEAYKKRTLPLLTPDQRADAQRYTDKFWHHYWHQNTEPELKTALVQDWHDWTEALEAKMEATPSAANLRSPFHRRGGTPGAGEALAQLSEEIFRVELPRWLEKGLDMQSTEGAIAIARTGRLPKSADYELSAVGNILSGIVGLLSPLSIATFGVGGAGGKYVSRKILLEKFIEQNAKKGSTGVLVYLGSRGAQRGLELGLALGTHTGVMDIATQVGLRDRIHILETLNNSAKSALLGFAAGGVGTIGRIVPGTGVVAEVAAFAAGGAYLDGRTPEIQDFIDAAGVIFGMRGAVGAAKLAGAKTFSFVDRLTETADKAQQRYKQTVERQAAEKKMDPWTIEEITGGDPFQIFRDLTVRRMEGVLAVMRNQLAVLETRLEKESVGKPPTKPAGPTPTLVPEAKPKPEVKAVEPVVETPGPMAGGEDAAAKAHIASLPGTGVGKAIGGGGRAIIDNMYKMYWDKMLRGDTTEGGQPSAFLQVAVLARRSGGIQTIAELRDLGRDYANVKSTGKARQAELQALVKKHSAPSTRPVPQPAASPSVVPAPAPSPKQTGKAKPTPKTPTEREIEDLKKEIETRQAEVEDWRTMEHNPFRDRTDSHVESYANMGVSLAKMELHRRRTGVESLVPVQRELSRYYKGDPTIPNSEKLLHQMEGIDWEITMGVTDERVETDLRIIERFLDEGDINKLTPWIFGPEFAASNHEGGRFWSGKVIEAGMLARHETDRDYEIIDKLERVLNKFKLPGTKFREWLEAYYRDLDMVDAARKLRDQGLKFSDVRGMLISGRSGARAIETLPELNGRQIARISRGDYGPFSPSKDGRPAGILSNLNLFYVTDSVATWFSNKRAQVVEYKKTMFRLALGPRQLRVFERVHDEMANIEQAIKQEKPSATRRHKTQEEVIRDILAEPQNEGISADDIKDMLLEYKDIDNWGQEFYIPRFEFGSYRGEIIIDPERDTRQTIAVAPTRRVLVERILNWVAENAPDTKEVWVQKGPTFTSSEAIEMVSRGKYWAVRSRFSKQAEKDIELALELKMPSSMEKVEIEELAKVISQAAARDGLAGNLAIRPPYKKAGPLLKTRGILTGEEDLIKAMRYYALQVNRKLALDPVIHQFRQYADRDLRGAKHLREMIENQLLVEKGNYSFGDQVFDGWMQKLDQWILRKTKGRYDTSSIPFLKIRSQYYSNMVAEVRKVVATAKLGWRPVAGLVNGVSGMNHLAAKVGFGYIVRARQFLNTPEGKSYISREAPYMGISYAMEEGSVKYPERLRPWNPMFLFQWPEKHLRMTTLAANFLYARETMGLADEAAAVFARRALRFQQFVYNAAALPYLLQGPSGKLVGQFKSYLVNEMQFLWGLRSKREILTYAGLQVAFGGTKGLMYLLYGMPVLGWVIEATDFEKRMNKIMPSLHRGLPAALPRAVNLAFGTNLPEVDLSMQFVPSVPHTSKDALAWMVGPLLSDMYGFGKWAYESAVEGVPDVQARGLELVNNGFVAWKYLQEGLSMAIDRDFNLTDMRGNVVWKPRGPVDIALNMIGMRSADYSLQNDVLREHQKEIRLKRKRLMAQGDRTLRLLQEYINANHIRTREDFSSVLDKIDNTTRGFLVEAASTLGGGYPKDFKVVADAINAYVGYGGNAQSLLEQAGIARMEPLPRLLIQSTLKERPEIIDSWDNLKRFRDFNNPKDWGR